MNDKNEWDFDPKLAKEIHDKWINGPVVPVFDDPEVKIIHIDTIHEDQLKDNDIIILTFDNEVWDVDKIKQWVDYFQQDFPNHKIIAKFNGIQIDIFHVEKDEREVSW